MKALVIDAAASCMHIAAKNDDFKASISLDLGQKQSQKLLPSIDYILEQVDLKSSDLEYTALRSRNLHRASSCILCTQSN